jgi:hypothetical protein
MKKYIDIVELAKRVDGVPFRQTVTASKTEVEIHPDFFLKLLNSLPKESGILVRNDGISVLYLDGLVETEEPAAA